MLKRILNLHLDAAPADGGDSSTKGAAAFTLDKAPPANVLKQEFSFDGEAADEVTKVDPSIEKEMNGGKPNNIAVEKEDPQVVELKKKGATLESEIGKDPAGEKKAVKEVEPAKPKNKLGSLDALKPTAADAGKVATKEEVKEDKTERDYSMFPEEWRPHAKKMGNDMYEILKTAIPKYQAQEAELQNTKEQLEQLWGGQIPQHLGQHPLAFQLHPAYQQLNSTYQQMEFEKNFAYQQLVRVKAGEPFQMLKGYRKDSGEPVFENIEAGTAAHEVALTQLLNAASTGASQARNQISSLQANYSKAYEGDLKMVENIKSSRWPSLKDKNAPIHGDIKEFLEAVPPRFHDHPATEVAALLYSDLKKAFAQIDELKKGAITNGKIKEDKALMDPKVNGEGGGESTLSGAALRSRLGIQGNAKFTPPATFDLSDE